MSTAPLRLGLVGCGRLAEAGYVPACARAAGVILVAVADPDADRRARVASAASRPGTAGSVATYTDAATLLHDADVDAVILATPAQAHVADATLAVEAGVPVLVEKPPAPDAAGAAQLTSLGPLVSVGFNRRFDPGAQAVRSALAGRGEVHLDLALGYRRASWGAHTVRDEVLIDLAPHLIDWARWLAGGEVTSVAAHELETDRCVLALTLTSGRATVVAAADAIHRERIEARNASGELLSRHRVGGLVAAVLGRLRRHDGPHPLEASLAAQLEAFARTVHGDRDPQLGTPADGHAVMTVIEAARRSASSGGQATPVNDPSEHAPC